MSPLRIERLEQTRKARVKDIPAVPVLHRNLQVRLTWATKLYGWNRRIFDFDLICAREGIKVIRSQMDHPGTYWPEGINSEGVPTINISPHLLKRGIEWVEMHELGHHLCGHTNPSPEVEDRMEAEADLFAAVALAPSFLLDRHSIREIQRCYPVTAELCESRLRIKAELGI